MTVIALIYTLAKPFLPLIIGGLGFLVTLATVHARGKAAGRAELQAKIDQADSKAITDAQADHQGNAGMSDADLRDSLSKPYVK
jgi:hypothetical protein